MNCSANKSRKNCAGGRQKCPTPWTCGGYEHDAHQAAMQAPVVKSRPREQAADDTAQQAKPRVPTVVLLVAAWLILSALIFGPDLWAAIQTWRTS